VVLLSVREFQKFPEFDVFDEAEADDAACADDAGCCFQNGSGVVLEGAEELGRLEEKQTGACRLEPGIRFKVGGDQRGLKAFTESNGSSAIAMHTRTAW
jgi:orotidine-5'-phosphate decarboxylase